MTRRLDLDEAQKGKVYALNLKKAQAFETACRPGQSRHTGWKQQHEQWRNDVGAVLTPEQRKRWKH